MASVIFAAISFSTGDVSLRVATPSVSTVGTPLSYRLPRWGLPPSGLRLITPLRTRRLVLRGRRGPPGHHRAGGGLGQAACRGRPVLVGAAPQRGAVLRQVVASPRARHGGPPTGRHRPSPSTACRPLPLYRRRGQRLDGRDRAAALATVTRYLPSPHRPLGRERHEGRRGYPLGLRRRRLWQRHAQRPRFQVRQVTLGAPAPQHCRRAQGLCLTARRALPRAEGAELLPQ
jgi:hypothetical protein